MYRIKIYICEYYISQLNGILFIAVSLY